MLIGDEPYFIAMDIAKALDYSDAYQMTRRLDDDEISNRQIGGLGTSSGGRGITLINESGLYSAILGSNKPEAKTFKKWVTKEVLPSIRKTGTYQIDNQTQKEVFNLIYETPCREAVLKAVKNIEKEKKAKVHSIKEYTITEKFKGNKAITNCEIGVQWDTPPLLNAKNLAEVQALNQRKRKYK
ncbi:hypothetical protein CQA40_06305 [Helicobacter sp. MIT 01-3238]|nr:hypothetical protein CQA40_06305 [Helicobacter sp. MIT 01-3238]